MDMKKFDEVLADSIASLLREPTWFSEADVQSEIYSELLKIPELKKKYPTKVSIGKNQKGEMSKETYKTNRLHREYGINELDNTRCDLIIFSEDDISNISDIVHLKTGKDKNSYLNPEIMIEFGTERSAGSADNFEKHIQNDIEKASKATKKGYIIHIQRASTVDNDIIKFQTKYLDVLKKNEPENSDKVKILFLLVSIGCEAPIFREGKVKIYKDGELIGINERKYEEEILNILK